MIFQHNSLSRSVAVLAIAISTHATAAGPGLIPPDAVRADLQAASSFIQSTHPAYDKSLPLGDVESRLAVPLTRDQAWAELARLNPRFGDGHVMIGFPDWRNEARAHLHSGGGFFPFEVSFNEKGALRIASWLGGQSTLLAGMHIKRINGRDARQLADEMMQRMHGDTPRFRAKVLGQRFWFLYWKLYGSPAVFNVEIESNRPMQLTPVGTAAVTIQDESSFERQHQFQLLPNKAAVLTLSSFSWPDKERYLTFTRDAFQRVKEHGVTTLLIDVRRNGGGSDSYWIDGILRYVADRPFRWASGYVKRVMGGREEAGQKEGDIVSGTVETWTQPVPDEPLHFGGRVFVLTGDGTYSSAILFANTVQDFRFATVVGPGGAARTRQSGGTIQMILPNTGLAVTSPRFVLERPSGQREPVLSTPDLILEDDVLAPRAMIDATLSAIARPTRTQRRGRG